MRVALIHDYLNQYGGAERVLETLLDMFPGAHVYTLMYCPERTPVQFRSKVYKTSILNFPIAWHHHRMFIPLMPLAVQSLRLENRYDLIISDSAGYAKGVPYRQDTFHLSYCYTPLRYAWEVDNYFANPIFKTLFRPAFQFLKRWDFKAAQAPDEMLAVSTFIAQKVQVYYRRTPGVVYPPVDYKRFTFDRHLQRSGSEQGYYLAAGRLLHYKRFDLLVESFLELRRNLWVVGAGPELPKLQRLAAGSNNIRFLKFVSDADLHALYSGARALLFPQVEDFGLVAAEAQACGTPVLAYAKGGSLEIVEEGRTGMFFHAQSVADVVEIVRKFERVGFDRHEISLVSRRFTPEKFREGIFQSLPAEIKEQCVA